MNTDQGYIFILNIIPALLVALFIGAKRRAGLGNVLLWSLSMGFVSGLVLSFLSRRKSDHTSVSIRKKKWVPQVGFVIFVGGLIGLGKYLLGLDSITDPKTTVFSELILPIVGFSGWISIGYYMCDFHDVDSIKVLK
jgi:hypothetical protein